jgi:hypothetical protein
VSLLGWAKTQFHNVVGEPLPEANPRLRGDPTVVHIGRRAHCRTVARHGDPHLKKVFTTATGGREGFASERLAQQRLRQLRWYTPWIRGGWHSFERPFLPEDCRLDRIAPRLSAAERLEYAGQALSMILDMLALGLAHRDFHAKNLFAVDGQLKLIDFETLTTYPEDRTPGLSQCYDVIGHGLHSPWHTGNMCFGKDIDFSVANVLGVDFEQAKEPLRAILKHELREASLTFVRHKGRHVCKQGRIYNTISLPGLEIGPEEAQRNCARRFEQFGLSESSLAGKRVLDLGSNIGGMLFQAQRYEPRECLGVEFDPPKVHVSRRVAAFCDIANVRFREGDIDTCTSYGLQGPYDTVLCLAVEGHVKDRPRLYRLLGEVTREVLYFEGNSSTDAAAAERQLRAAGFSRVEQLGSCDDDSLPDNNCRPVLRAFK